MTSERGTRSTVMFVVGLAMALLAGGLMFVTDRDSGPLIVVGIIGLVLIAVSGMRPLSR